MTINVFLDTEFTALENSAKLISIGLITEDGARSFYAELSDTYKKNDCSTFVIDEVLPLLDAPENSKVKSYRSVYSSMSLAELKTHLQYWFAALIDPVQVWSDSVQHDWRFIQQVFNEGFPHNLISTPREIQSENTSSNAKFTNIFEKEISKAGARRHHAMDDAKAIRKGWLKMKGYN